MQGDMPTVGELFAGIGGIGLGLERAGWTVRWQVEWDEWCQRILAKHWPDIKRYGDITAVDWSGVERVDLLAGGFPCQPISQAGRQQAQADPRWLWPEFHRAIRALRPRYVLVENVPPLLFVNRGTAFGDVLGDLAASGYDCEWDGIPASAVGAPHERDRVWLVAYPRCFDSERRRDADLVDGASRAGAGEAPEWQRVRNAVVDRRANVADTTGGRQPGPRKPVLAFDSATAANGQAAKPLDGRLADFWRVEPDVGRVVDGLSPGLARWRKSALKGLGNAVVPQVVQIIGRRLLEAETQR